jgi:uncharacterized membrane protein YphA (DoxX/SURF4 family)
VVAMVVVMGLITIFAALPMIMTMIMTVVMAIHLAKHKHSKNKHKPFIMSKGVCIACVSCVSCVSCV